MFDTIRKLNYDARVISRNTDYPQYKIQQLKSKLFMVANSQNNRVCEWWLRLYQGNYSQSDLSALSFAIDGKDYWMEYING